MTMKSRSSRAHGCLRRQWLKMLVAATLAAANDWARLNWVIYRNCRYSSSTRFWESTALSPPVAHFLSLSGSCSFKVWANETMSSSTTNRVHLCTLIHQFETNALIHFRFTFLGTWADATGNKICFIHSNSPSSQSIDWHWKWKSRFL